MGTKWHVNGGTIPGGLGRVEGVHSTKFYRERLRLEVQTLTLLYAIFYRKARYPFRITSIENCTPFIYLRGGF